MLTAEEILAVLEACPAGIVVCAADGRIRWLNAGMADMLGEPAEALIGRGRNDFSAPHLRALLELPELLYVPAHHGDRYLSCRRTRLGEATVGFFIDVSGEHALSREIAELARLVRDHVPRDPLTGLLNHRGLHQDLERHAARSRRYANPLAVMLLVPRDFAGYERTHGPAASQNLLVEISRMLRDQTRWADSIGRLEDTAEFTLILPETDEAAARKLADKLRRQLRALRLEGGECVEVEAAFGLAQWRKGDDAGMLLRRAREQLETARAD